MQHSLDSERRPTAGRPWTAPWARVVAAVVALVPLGLAGTGMVTMSTAVGQASWQWMLIGLATTIGSAAVALPLAVFLVRGGKGWFGAGLALALALVIAIAWLALDGA